jgi:hypothetical protein
MDPGAPVQGTASSTAEKVTLHSHWLVVQHVSRVAVLTSLSGQESDVELQEESGQRGGGSGILDKARELTSTRSNPLDHHVQYLGSSFPRSPDMHF